MLAIPGSAQDILIPVNNLADVPNADEALDNLGGTTVGKALFTATDAAAARSAVGVGTSAAASKSDQQAGTDATKAVTPSHQQDHDSAAKAWGYITQSGGVYTPAAGYNIASVTKNSTGDVTINFTTPFASTNFAAIYSINQLFGPTAMRIINETKASRTTSSVEITIATGGTGGAVVDSDFSFVAYGRQ